ncbi:DNA phosphorothioation system sulfurtransferase DndC [Texcoconibacillus texcoconensis]|uniref:DNA sulfur modification protein DndC n=1 Tax=Texcoconibacillus texcoconensis TaxID=1095777 RepID=A0A840QM41_9BACI|nr:DNA phosphorothioation system sulfurtransferase DndC [Texcoconibacillus texcoconensis]MBB5172438.1 DNA sulfur modification protein DndC [Texcoconibacillus texcoconensis]
MDINIFSQNDKFEKAKQQIKEVYLSDDRPWVLGYSGGKDSTTVTQLVFDALSELDPTQLHKKVYVISSDTLVETPLIISSITRTLGRIQDQALEQDLPIETHKVRPETDKTFWSSIIGKGYPSPRQKFRWCTDRMKIDPANRFIMDKVSKFGEVVMILGIRDNESSTRAGVMKSHTTEGKLLMRHSSLPNAYVYAPIRDFVLDDVWEYLLTYKSPWGDDNNELLKLYQDSNSECPLVVDQDVKESAGSCGNSRFGCWTCTVVTEDKALSGFINSGEEWLRPLLEFRNWLADIRDVREYRQKHRMNGQVYLTSNLENIDPDQCEKIPESELGDYIKKNNIDLAKVKELNLIVIDEEGNYKQLGLGPFTLNAREMILRRLLETQQKVRELHDPSLELISEEELKMIRKIWLNDGDWEDRVPKIVEELSGDSVDWEYNDRPLFEEEQITDLERLCQENNVSLSLMKKLISVERGYSGYKIRRGLHDDFEKILKQQYLHL